MRFVFLSGFLIVVCAALAQTPAPSNVRGSEYPLIHPDRRVTFRVAAPTARSVAVAGRAADSGMNGNKPYEMTRGEGGVWTVTTDPVRPGFHYYELIIDGQRTTDPSSETYFGWARQTSGLEVPDPELDFYDARSVPHGEVRLRWYSSKVTGTLRRIYVYTPPDYDQNLQRRYPVLYLQHGAGESERGWTAQGRANFILDNLIAAGKVRPMIIVMENGYAIQAGAPPVEGSRGSQAFEQLVVHDLVPMIDVTYRTLADRNHRAIAGLSMGAGQALQTGLANLDKFAYVAGFSGGVRDFDLKRAVQACASLRATRTLLNSKEVQDEAGFHGLARGNRGAAGWFGRTRAKRRPGGAIALRVLCGSPRDRCGEAQAELDSAGRRARLQADRISYLSRRQPGRFTEG